MAKHSNVTVLGAGTWNGYNIIAYEFVRTAANLGPEFDDQFCDISFL